MYRDGFYNISWFVLYSIEYCFQNLTISVDKLLQGPLGLAKKSEIF